MHAENDLCFSLPLCFLLTPPNASDWRHAMERTYGIHTCVLHPVDTESILPKPPPPRYLRADGGRGYVVSIAGPTQSTVSKSEVLPLEELEFQELSADSVSMGDERCTERTTVGDGGK